MSRFNTFIVSIILTLVLFGASSRVSAGSAENIRGFAWSDTIGWISFNNLSDGNLNSYGVNKDATGNLVGYAWSDNIGWIQFGGLSGFPSGGGTVAVNARVVGNAWEGWVRAIAGVGRTDGWDGWISLKGTGYGTTQNGTLIQGWAWGSEVVGWVDMSRVSMVVPASQPTATLSVNPTTVVSGGSTTLTWTSANATSCTGSSNPATSWSGIKSLAGSQTVSGLVSNTTFSLTCTGPGGQITATANVTVSAAGGRIQNYRQHQNSTPALGTTWQITGPANYGPSSANGDTTPTISTGGYTLTVTDLAGMNESYRWCLYPIGGTECNAANSGGIVCNGSTCTTTLGVAPNQVSKTVIIYTPIPAGTGSVRSVRANEDGGFRDTLARVDLGVLTTDNPRTFSNISAGNHDVYVSDLPGFDEYYTIRTYPEGSGELFTCSVIPATGKCSLATYSNLSPGIVCGLPNGQGGSLCKIGVTVTPGVVTKVAVLYVLPANGDVEIKRVGESDTTATSPATQAKLEDAITPTGSTQNPLRVNNVSSGVHTATVSNVPGYIITAGFCDTPGCTISNFNLVPSCVGPRCNIQINVKSNALNRIVFKYLRSAILLQPGEIRNRRIDSSNQSLPGTTWSVNGGTPSTGQDESFSGAPGNYNVTVTDPPGGGSYVKTYLDCIAFVGASNCNSFPSGYTTVTGCATASCTWPVTIEPNKTRYIVVRYAPQASADITVAVTNASSGGGGGADYTTGMVSRWMFDDNLSNSVATAPAGTAAGTIAYSADAKNGKSLSLSNPTTGTANLVRIPNASPISFSDGNPYTVSVWFKASSLGTYKTLFTKAIDRDNRDYSFFINSPSGGYVASGKTDGDFWNSTGFTANTWHHLAMVRSGQNVNVYLDKNFKFSPLPAQNGIGADSGGDLGVGGLIADNGGAKWDGLIDDFRIYNAALTLDQITQIHDSVGSAPVNGGTGRVTSSAGKFGSTINCTTPNSGVCSAVFANPSTVTLNAFADNGSIIESWGGSCQGIGTINGAKTAGACTLLNLGANANVTVTFGKSAVKPPAPTGFTAGAGSVCGSTIALRWNSVVGAIFTLKEGSTVLYRGPNTSYEHTGLIPGNPPTHSYTLTATVGGVESDPASASGSTVACLQNLSCSTDVSTSWSRRDVTWTVYQNAVPLQNPSYTYLWSGSEGLTGSGSTVTRQYFNIGTKTAQVSVFSAGLNGPVTLGSATCASLRVIQNPNFNEI